MRKKGILLSEPLGILIALLIMFAVFAVLWLSDEQNRQALTQSIEIADRAEGYTISEGDYGNIRLEKIRNNLIKRCGTCDRHGK